MVPPAYYPSEMKTIDLKVQAKDRIFSQSGSLWLKLCESTDLVSKSSVPGGYYLKLNQNQPTSQVEWFSNNDIKIENPEFETIEFSKTACHRIEGFKQPIAVLAARQKQQ